MEGIRIVELPQCRMASSGPADEGNPFIENGVLRSFGEWFSVVDQTRTDRFFPRDFMWYDRETQRLVWYYVLPDGITDTGGFEVVDFEGGLYAAHISKDGDEADGERVYAGIKVWLAESDHFLLDERPGHYDLFHIITPPRVAEAIGYSQLDIYVPIKLREAGG